MKDSHDETLHEACSNDEMTTLCGMFWSPSVPRGLYHPVLTGDFTTLF
jgi:hypothetical protein